MQPRTSHSMVKNCWYQLASSSASDRRITSHVKRRTSYDPRLPPVVIGFLPPSDRGAPAPHVADIEGCHKSAPEARGRAPMRRTNPDWWKTNP
jgi:hypothetical protein